MLTYNFESETLEMRKASLFPGAVSNVSPSGRETMVRQVGVFASMTGLGHLGSRGLNPRTNIGLLRSSLC